MKLSRNHHEGMNLDDVVPPPGAALVEDLDKRLLIQLRDGRKIVGTLRHVFITHQKWVQNLYSCDAVKYE